MREWVPDGGSGVRIGWALLLLCAVLAPGVGGVPAGDRYGADTALGALRLLPIAAALLILPARGSGSGRIAAWAAGVAGAWAALSLLARSSLLTDPVLLFAMVPGALDTLAGVAAFLSARALGADPKGRVGIAAALALGMLWTAVSVALEVGASVPGHRASGTFFSPNFTAGLLGLCLPLAAALCLEARERLGALLWGVVAALGFGATVATGSRSGIALAAGGLGLALLLAAARRGGKLPWGRIAALLAAFAVLAFAFRNAVLVRAATGGAQEHSGAFRSRTWDGTLAMAAANPVFGAGPGTFTHRYGPYARVAWTGQAHSSYLQTAAEQGFPALAAFAAALLGALVAGLRGAWKGERGILGAAVAGGLLVGILRGFLDSESMVAGNALPLWTLAGLACADGAATRGARAAWLWAAPLLLGLANLLSGSDPWPPDPARLAAAGKFEEAARVEPTARRFFALARRAEAQGDVAGAVSWFQKARDADPNALQTQRALAEAQERAGDAAGALATWRDLVRRHEGPPGQVRALPELTETWAAFAYAALARDAAGDPAAARTWWEKARALIDAYTRTTPLFQEVELQQVAGRTIEEQAARLKSRRDELRGLLAEMAKAGVDPGALATALDAMDERTARALRPAAN